MWKMGYVCFLFSCNCVFAHSVAIVTDEEAYESSELVLVIEAEGGLMDGRIMHKPLYSVKGRRKYGIDICPAREDVIMYRERRVLESEGPSVVFLARSPGGCFHIKRSFAFVKDTNCIDVENIFTFPEVNPYKGKDESFETFIALVSDNRAFVPYWLTDYRKQCRKVVDGRVVK